jgi:hypothetical protein
MVGGNRIGGLYWTSQCTTGEQQLPSHRQYLGTQAPANDAIANYSQLIYVAFCQETQGILKACHDERSAAGTPLPH